MGNVHIPQAETIDDRPVWSKLGFWVAAIAFFGTFANGAMIYKTSTDQNDFDKIQVIINHLADELDKAKKREERSIKIILDQGKEILRLMSELQDKTSQMDLLQSFIEALPFPAWIKQKGDDGVFRIVTINENFVIRYGISKKRAVGKSDFELYPLDLAEEYQRGDREVQETGKTFRSSTEMLKAGKLVPVEYIKFTLNLPSGFEGIGGVITD